MSCAGDFSSQILFMALGAKRNHSAALSGHFIRVTAYVAWVAESENISYSGRVSVMLLL